MKAKDLRNSILQLAIQGKLVEQNPHDEPASVLLEKIQAEKKQLIKEGKIKKQKVLPPIVEDETPFDIPDNWEWVRLGEIGFWASGATPQKANKKYYDNGTIPWLRTGDLNDGYISEIPLKITELALCETSVKLNKAGAVLIAMYGATIGKTGILQIVATTNQACCACRLYANLNNIYLQQFLISQKSNFNKQAEGGAQPNISREKIINYYFPLPPLAEQQRIVEKLEQIMPLIDEYEKLEEQLTKLEDEFPDKLKKSILQYAVQGKLVEQNSEDEPASILLEKIQAEKKQLIKEGKIKKQKALSPIADDEKPFDIPDSWEWVRLGELGITQTGTTPSKTHNEYFGGEIPFIKPGDISSYGIIYNNESLSEKGLEKGRTIPKHSIMMVCIGGSIGKTYYTDKICSCNQQINAITFLGDISFLLMFYFMSSFFFTESVRKNSTGTATPIINKSSWDNLLVPLPPLEDQQRIVDKVEELFALVDIISSKDALLAYKTKLSSEKVIEAKFKTQAKSNDNIKAAARGNINKSDLEIAKEIFIDL